MSLTVGFIGLGSMGTPIATNLLDASGSPTLRIWNRSTEKVSQLREVLAAERRDRVVPAASPADAVPAPDGVVVSLVVNDAALEAIVTGTAGVLERLGEGGVHLCLSTVSPATSERMQALHAAKGAAYIACPVFGRPPVAAAKKLIAVPAGPDAAVERILPLLEATAQKIVRAGPNPASASVLKLCGNFMILSVLEMCGEAFALAEAHGIDRAVAYDLLAGPTGVLSSLPVVQGYGRMIAHHEYTPVGFTALNGLKDATLICNAAASGPEGKVTLPLAELVRDRLTAVVAREGGAEQDWASLAADIKPTK